jgi:ABC-2 type transport system permease protein
VTAAVTSPSSATAPARRTRPLAALVGHQFRYDLLVFWRNPQSRFFTLLLPVLFLLIFASVFGNSTVDVAGGTIKQSTYYVPGIIALGVISAAFVNLIAAVTGERESGVYKRRRATPVPAVALIASRTLLAVLTALGIAVTLVLLGWALFGASIPGRTAPALVIDIVLGTVVFCCLGFALASVIGNAEAATPMVQAITLPLYFISGVFVASSELPHWLVHVSSVFPVRHLAAALLVAYNPHTTGSGFRPWDLVILLAWGAVGLLVAVRRFSWLPAGE